MRGVDFMKNTVVITGASRGIGKACALAFAEKGYSLFLTSNRHAELLEETAQAARAFGVTVYTAPNVDIGDYQMCDEFIWRKIDALDLKIDCLVNNAGISHIGLLQDMSWEEWQNVMNVNLGSVFTMCRHVIPYMLKAGHGKIVNVSSVWGNVGASCEVAYSASKGGVNSFTRALAKELAPSNIQVNAIAFGAIDTDMNRFLSDAERADLVSEIPAGRMGSPKEAAELIVSICSDCGTYLTGQIISMDGGWH
jgi:3-oxoacyl-[acyl-carrier protein] reductase